YTSRSPARVRTYPGPTWWIPFASDDGRSRGTTIAGGSIGVAIPITPCAIGPAAISAASATIFFRCRAKTPSLATSQLAQRAEHRDDDPRGILHAVEMRDTRPRITHGHGH